MEILDQAIAIIQLVYRAEAKQRHPFQSITSNTYHVGVPGLVLQLCGDWDLSFFVAGEATWAALVIIINDHYRLHPDWMNWLLDIDLKPPPVVEFIFFDFFMVLRNVYACLRPMIKKLMFLIGCGAKVHAVNLSSQDASRWR